MRSAIAVVSGMLLGSDDGRRAAAQIIREAMEDADAVLNLVTAQAALTKKLLVKLTDMIDGVSPEDLLTHIGMGIATYEGEQDG